MRWAACNPEKYEECSILGVTDRISELVKPFGGTPTEEEYEGIRSACEAMALSRDDEQIRKVWDGLMAWAAVEISEHMADAVSGL